MKTRILFFTGALATGLLVLGGVARFALAQQASELQVMFNAQRCHVVNQGQRSTWVLQGDVTLSRRDAGPINLTTTSDGFVYTSPGAISASGVDQTEAKIPMDMATLRVSVSASGTVFEDAKGDKLTVEASSSTK